MNVPKWLNAVLQQFGEGIDIHEFGLNDQGAASLLFETGASLRFEYAFESLVVAMLVPTAQDPELMKRLLSYAQPELRPAFKLRVAYLAKSSCALFAARLSEREVTLPVLNAVFTELWRMSEDFRRRIV